MTLLDDNAANHIPEDDLVLFALQLLPDERMRQALPHLQTCPQCRSEIAKIQGDLAAYSTTADPQAPPPSARDRFTRQVAREPRVTELPAFDLKPTEYDLKQQEKLALIPQPEPQAAPAPERVRDTFESHSQNLFQERRREYVEDRREDRREDRLEDRRSDRLEDRRDDRRSDRLEDRREDRHDRRDDRIEDRASSPREPLFPARQSRSLSDDSVEEDALASRRQAEPAFPARQTRSLRTEDVDQDHGNRFEERRRPRRAPWILAWTGWAVAAGCSFVAGLQLHQRQQVQGTIAAQQAKIADMQKQAVHAQDAQVALSTLTSANAMQVALHAAPPLKPATAIKGAPPVVPPEALAAYLADKGALVFVATHLQPAPAGKTYELWLLPANGQNPIPAGTFKPDTQGGASVVMPKLPTGVQAKGFGVTVENDGGSQTPTMPIVMS